MKTLIYTTAFGAEYYFLLAEELCRSLVRMEYDGDVVVLTDRPYPFTRAKSIVMTHSPVLYKASLHRYVDVSRYDRILCCDGDIVFTGNPAPLFGCGRERVAFSYELDYPLKSAPHNLRYFSREEKQKIAGENHALLNVGLTVFPPERISEYCERWARTWEALVPDRFQIWEQAVMQRLVTLEDVACDLVPRELFSFPLLKWDARPLGPQTVAVHPCGLAWNAENKARVLQIMQALNAAGSHEERAEICANARVKKWDRLSSTISSRAQAH